MRTFSKKLFYLMTEQINKKTLKNLAIAGWVIGDPMFIG